MPISSEAAKAPGQRAHAATTTTTKITGPTTAAMFGSVRKVMPPITPASPPAVQPAPNTSMNTARHVVAERLHHLGVRQRGLDHQPDARAGEHQPQAAAPA